MPPSPRQLAWKYTGMHLALVYLPLILLLSLIANAFLGVSGIIGIGAAIGTLIPTYFAFRNLFNPNYQRSSSVDQTDYLTIHLPYHLAFQRCLDSLDAVGEPTVLVQDRTQGIIDAALLSKPLWRQLLIGLGARVQFRLGSDHEGTTVIRVTSRAPLSTHIFDFGVHRRNLNSIRLCLENTAR